MAVKECEADHVAQVESVCAAEVVTEIEETEAVKEEVEIKGVEVEIREAEVEIEEGKVEKEVEIKETDVLIVDQGLGVAEVKIAKAIARIITNIITEVEIDNVAEVIAETVVSGMETEAIETEALKGRIEAQDGRRITEFNGNDVHQVMCHNS